MNNDRTTWQQLSQFWGPEGGRCTQVSISSTFYECLFCTKMLWAAFLCLHFGYDIFWQQNIGAKAARKILMKLTTGFTISVNFFKSIFRKHAIWWQRLAVKVVPAPLCDPHPVVKTPMSPGIWHQGSEKSPRSIWRWSSLIFRGKFRSFK